MTHVRGVTPSELTTESSRGNFFGAVATQIGWEVRYSWERLRTVELRRGEEYYLVIPLRSEKRSERGLGSNYSAFGKARRDKCYQRDYFDSYKS